VDYAFGILKTSTTNNTPQYAIRVGNAQAGDLTTAYDGQAPAAWQGKGGLILGIGGDNSNSSLGTFFEGALTAGRPSDATDAAVLQNVQAVGYGI
jgi:non-reducing end alpha-L-arabinofuranosidase